MEFTKHFAVVLLQVEFHNSAHKVGERCGNVVASLCGSAQRLDEAVFLSELAQLVLLHVVLQVAASLLVLRYEVELIEREHHRDSLPISKLNVRVNLLLPDHSVVQRLLARDVSHYHRADCVSAKELRDSTKPILACNVPQLQTNVLVVESDDFKRKLAGDSRTILSVELAVHELVDERRFAREGIAYYQNFVHISFI